MTALPAQSGSGVQCREDVARELRKLAIVQVHRPGYNFTTVHVGYRCKVCDTDWDIDASETHGATCVLAPKPAGQPVEGGRISFPRWWVQQTYDTLKAIKTENVPEYPGDVIFLLRDMLRDALSAPASPHEVHERDTQVETHGLDNERQVFFYEQDFYVLSNFSAFKLHWSGHHFDTSEAAYHWEKFNCYRGFLVQQQIVGTASAHEAFKIAERHKQHRRSDWDAIKVSTMRDILRAKADQHEYVRRKLLATGDRELVENSWRDDFWGWGANRDGKNMLGKLWMEIRTGLRAQQFDRTPLSREPSSPAASPQPRDTDK